jgi:Na+/H+-translocating membrane pyrophosphatase
METERKKETEKIVEITTENELRELLNESFGTVLTPSFYEKKTIVFVIHGSGRRGEIRVSFKKVE